MHPDACESSSFVPQRKYKNAFLYSVNCAMMKMLLKAPFALESSQRLISESSLGVIKMHDYDLFVLFTSHRLILAFSVHPITLMKKGLFFPSKVPENVICVNTLSKKRDLFFRDAFNNEAVLDTHETGSSILFKSGQAAVK